MKRKSSVTKKPYYKRILIFMTLFLVLIFLPFSFSSYEISKKNIMDNINSSNTAVLSQMNYNYQYFSKNISNICMELFLNYNTRQYLYSGDVSYNDAAAYMRDVAETTLQTNPSINSITLYNHTKKEWYSTKSDPAIENKELSDFVSKQESIPKLQPILRQVNRQVAGINTPFYVFSYFVYEFADPTLGSDSYIVLTQNSDWFIDSIVNIKQNESVPSFIYLLDEQGNVCNNMGKPISDVNSYLIHDYNENRTYDNSESSQYYTKKLNNDSYIITSVSLGNQGNSLIMIQDFKDVFKNLINLRNEFVLVGIVFCIISVVLLILFSERIYSPVRGLISHVSSSSSEKSEQHGREGEFDFLRNIYQNANNLNQNLLTRTESFEPMVEQYQLYNTIVGNIDPEFDMLKKTIPNHWLINDLPIWLSIVFFKIDHFENNQFEFKSTDKQLLMFAVSNIVHELLFKEYVCSSFYYDKNTLAVVVNLKEEKSNADILLPLLEKCQKCIKQSLDITVSVAYSDVGTKTKDLPFLCTQVSEDIQYRYLFGSGAIINRSKCLLNINSEQSSYPHELDEKLTDALRKKDIQEIIAATEDIKNSLYSLNYRNITVGIMVLLNKINATLNEMNQAGEMVANIKYNDIYKKAVELEFIEDFFTELNQYIKSAFTKDDRSEESKDALYISAIIDFVQQNYSDINLSSQTIGEYLGLSSRYTMRKFKESTGSSLSEYILAVRMRKAASLIRNTDYPISKIVEQIGIDSDTYFYKLFKKAYHCTPREFEEQHRLK